MKDSSKEEDVLEALSNLGKSRIRLAIVDLLISSERPLTVREIAEKLKANTNTVSVILHHLNKQNIVERVQRGSYRIKVTTLLKALLPLITSDFFRRFVIEYKSKFKKSY
ncbi:MAG: ArsR/SmtB family transcription factor [Candidatus Njordarchaeia archaeon]